MESFKINDKSFACPVDLTLNTIMGKWKPVILNNLMDGKKRYGELQKLLPNVTDRVLTKQLRELETDGIVTRKVYPVVPPKVEYSITDRGRTIKPILDAMCDWGSKFKVD
ncbi:winged helix-turn-helix transcriptional regulator [Chengkuizengella axinellae]|uniref:Helix-turn-helix domain-containing protein n=1 Tax=Chengkuizengella axinellae TaxID=3064388 RepID=A0ABT9IWG2_9BACL|nr:helix-turn-helix domain-containing protein [Chengkuizengella sp. 2205SS18-9]MDP5273598.1 helix-turn-helix domain-containing protein [Chengkuizengella sp. 2205SS18-9]